MATDKSEKREISRSGGTAQKNSGRGKYQKGDGKIGPFIFDVKEYSESFGVSKKVWAKCSKDAYGGHKEPAIKIVLGDTETGRLRLWVVADEMFTQMLNAWEEKYGE